MILTLIASAFALAFAWMAFVTWRYRMSIPNAPIRVLVFVLTTYVCLLPVIGYWMR